MNESASTPKEPFTAMLPAVVYFAWAYAFLWLLDRGRFMAFLQPALWPLLAGGLALSLFFLITALRRSTPTCHQHRVEGAAAWTRTALLLLPILFLIVSYNTGLGGYAYGKRAFDGGPLFPSSMAAIQNPEELPRDPDGTVRPTMLELVVHSNALEGKRVRTQGKVFHGTDVPEDHVRVYRFVIACCAADAQPAAVLVRGEGIPELAHDSWVEVTGVMHQIEIDGITWLRIDADTAETLPTPSPGDQYLFLRLWW